MHPQSNTHDPKPTTPEGFFSIKISEILKIRDKEVDFDHPTGPILLKELALFPSQFTRHFKNQIYWGRIKQNRYAPVCPSTPKISPK
jgi:hypothetical protein